jgi:hypothetical protein
MAKCRREVSLSIVKLLRLALPAVWAFGLFLGCGVKGDPLPPELPPEIGRGEPTYRRSLRTMNQEEDVNSEVWDVDRARLKEKSEEESSDEE